MYPDISGSFFETIGTLFSTGTLQHQKADSGGDIISQEQEQHKSSSTAATAQAEDAQGSSSIAPGSGQSPPPSTTSTSGGKGWLDQASEQGWAIENLCDGSVMYRTGQRQSAASQREDVDQEVVDSGEYQD